ncbi:MAG: Na(+)-translocating NADH-quinone reductase subunit C [Planctomycetota bacterium]|nr:Na(+)-translocating NADH-quinone reductase subunit C [Planctomycetota bacterium]
MDRDSVGNTIKVAALLCVVCSVLVSATAVGLRDRQATNRLEELQRNVLIAADIYDSARPIQEQFAESVEIKFYRFPDGKFAGKLLTDQEMSMYASRYKIDFAKFNQRKTSLNPDTSTELDSTADIAGIKRRELVSAVYFVRHGDHRNVVLPIRGYGLWSTLWGFISIDESSLGKGPEAVTIRGLSYYDHKETPGLGGEVDNPSWKAKWPGKRVYGADGAVKIEVAKAAHGDAQVDSLSGATITSQGVTNMMRFWLGEQGFQSLLLAAKQ